MKDTTTIARLHLSQPLWRRIRSSIVMGVDKPLKPAVQARRILADGTPNYATNAEPGRCPAPVSLETARPVAPSRRVRIEHRLSLTDFGRGPKIPPSPHSVLL